MIRLATFQWKVFGIVLCFLLTLPLVILRADALSFRIINGADAVQGEYPFMVAISVKGAGTKFHHTCGGSYIHVHWVLTAAHCLKPRWLITKYYLNIGSVDFDAGKFYRRKGVKRIIHNEYADRPIPRNDIGLIKINQPFGDRSHRTGIPKHFAYTVNTTVIALGFGATQLFDNKECAVDPKKLQKLTTRIKERMFNIDSNTFFIGQYNNNVCFGDSGGPVLHNKTLIGVISSIGYSKSPNCEATYARVVKVVKYYDWIQLSINSTSYLVSHYPMLPYTILFWYHYHFFLIL